MAEINLEAEQVVGEEEEEAPAKSRGRIGPKLLLIVGGILIVEAVILVTVFNAMVSTASPVDADEMEDVGPQLEPEAYFKDRTLVTLGEVSIFDESSPDPRADRKFSVELKVEVSRERYMKFEALDVENDGVLSMVQEELRGACKNYMARQGLQALKSQDFQLNLGLRLKNELNDRSRNPLLAGSIIKVHVGDSRLSKF